MQKLGKIRYITLTLAIMLLFSLSTFPATAAETDRVLVLQIGTKWVCVVENGTETWVELPSKPTSSDGKTLVPSATITQLLGGTPTAGETIVTLSSILDTMGLRAIFEPSVSVIAVSANEISESTLKAMPCYTAFKTPAKDAVKYAKSSVTVSGKAFSVQTLTIDLKNPHISLDVYMPDKKLNNTVNFATAVKAKQPIAAVNGNFFNAYSVVKDPIGHLMSNGEFLYASTGITSIGISKNKNISFGMPSVFTDVYTVDNNDEKKAQTSTLYEINVLSQKGNQAVLYTPARGASVPITENGMIIEVIDNVVTKHYTVASGATANIPANGYLLYFNNEVTKLDYFKPVSVGRKVAIKYRLFKEEPEGFDLSNSKFILSGAPRLVKSGALDTTPLPTGFAGDNRFSVNSAPRTAAGKLADGRLILVSTSSTVAQLKEIMLKLGCTDAVNLDGGASAAMYYNGSVLTTPGRELTSMIMIMGD